MELVVDLQEYTSLCAALAGLAKEWRSKSTVDKELASELYVLASVTRNMAADASRGNESIKRQIEELATELDGLVMECFHTPGGE